MIYWHKINRTPSQRAYEKYGLNYNYFGFEYRVASIRKNSNMNRNLYNNSRKANM